MSNYDKKSPFERAFMTAVFIGIADTAICLIYNVMYRDYTGFPLSAIFNVSSLIFAVNLLFMVIGIVYFAFIKLFKKGNVVFGVVFGLLTLFLVWKGLTVQRADTRELNVGFRGLLEGIIVILGVSASFFLPYLYQSKKFEEHVL